MRAQSLLLLPILLLTHISLAQTLPDDAPKLPPLFANPPAESPEELQTPLATHEEQRNFDQASAPFLAEARKGDATDKLAAVKFLRRQAALPATSPGTRRLTLLAALELAKEGRITMTEVYPLAKDLLAALDGPAIPFRARRAAVLADLYDATEHKSKQYSAGVVAHAYLELAESQFYANSFSDAERSLTTGKMWAQRDPAYFESITPALTAFRADLADAAAIQNALLDRPNDSPANLRKGLLLLSRGALAQAAPCLAKSDQKEFKRLATVLDATDDTIPGHLEFASALGDCLPLTADRIQLALVTLLQYHLAEVTADTDLTSAEKTRPGELATRYAPFLRAVATTQPADNTPKTSFYGLAARATRVVYIIDHSGSLLDNFDFLREDLKRSVGKLAPTQSFNVVMVSEESHTVLDATKLLPATPESKKEFMKKIAEYRHQGMNDDLLEPFQQAFEAAFKLKPDLIYFLTDGHFKPELLTVLKTLNTPHTVRINTLAFINHEPEYEVQLKQMARQNKGTYKFVSERNLGR